jgi:hypothetical protein
MRKQELIAVLIVSLALGLGMIIIFSGGNLSLIRRQAPAFQEITGQVHNKAT